MVVFDALAGIIGMLVSAAFIFVPLAIVIYVVTVLVKASGQMKQDAQAEARSHLPEYKVNPTGMVADPSERKLVMSRPASGGTIIAFLGVFFVVRQQHAGVVERFGKFHHIVESGLNVKLPIVDKVRDVSLMTEDEHMRIDAKTKDNVTIGLDVSVQYMVDGRNVEYTEDSGVYRSLYTLSDPVGQMRDYFADALRSQIPMRTLDAVFEEKDEIAYSIGEAVSGKMLAYGYEIVTTLITSINLPDDVRTSMNRIVSTKNDLVSASNEADADKVRTVRAAEAKAEAMRVEGEGIANQRKAIAEGLASSIGLVQQAGLSSDEANALLMFTQNVGMMEKFAESGKSSTVVLPSEMATGDGLYGKLLSLQERE